LPDELQGGSGVILYSGNWGVAHDENTFIEAGCARRRLRQSADRVERELRASGVPFCRSSNHPATAKAIR
jgi:hypothetical protein